MTLIKKVWKSLVNFFAMLASARAQRDLMMSTAIRKHNLGR